MKVEIEKSANWHLAWLVQYWKGLLDFSFDKYFIYQMLPMVYGTTLVAIAGAILYFVSKPPPPSFRRPPLPPLPLPFFLSFLLLSLLFWFFLLFLFLILGFIIFSCIHPFVYRSFSFSFPLPFSLSRFFSFIHYSSIHFFLYLFTLFFIFCIFP